MSAPRHLVRVNKEYVEKRHVQLGRAFIEDGVEYQTSIRQARFETVEEGGTFRFRDRWYRKLRKNLHVAYPLEPNMPFGAPIIEAGAPLSFTHTVDVLEVVCRGKAAL